MALARARIAGVLVLMLLGSAHVALCDLPRALPPATDRYPHTLAPSRDAEKGEASIRSPDGRNVSVRAVALKHAEDNVGELDHQKRDDADVVRFESTDSKSGIAMARDVHRMMAMRRGRSLRTSKPYPCSLPAGTQCTRTETCCGSACADVATNRKHCGRCGHVCKSDRACCNGKCRRLATDERNCGRCGSRCALGIKCLFGLCGSDI